MLSQVCYLMTLAQKNFSAVQLSYAVEPRFKTTCLCHLSFYILSFTLTQPSVGKDNFNINSISSYFYFCCWNKRKPNIFILKLNKPSFQYVLFELHTTVVQSQLSKFFLQVFSTVLWEFGFPPVFCNSTVLEDNFGLPRSLFQGFVGFLKNCLSFWFGEWFGSKIRFF